MTEERFLSSIFCDDVRREEGNKLSYMGVYQGNLLVPEFPIVLPRLCVAVQMRTSPSPPKELTFRLLRDAELIGERQIDASALRNLPRGVVEDALEASVQIVGTIFQIFPLQLTGPCKFRVRALCDGQEFKGGTLVVDQLRVTVQATPPKERRPPGRPVRKK